MAITKQDVELAGKLAHMRIGEEEIALYEAQLKALFNWVQELAVVDTTNVQLGKVELAAHVRPDEPVQDDVLARTLRGAFAAQENDSAKVKKVL